MATSFFGTEYTVNHLGLPDSLEDNIRIEEHDAGHMMYIHEKPLAKTRADVESSYLDTKTMAGRGDANVPGGR